MANVCYIGVELVTVPELGNRLVQPDEVVAVPDERFDGYVCQSQAWESVEEPKAARVTTKTTAAAKTAPGKGDA